HAIDGSSATDEQLLLELYPTEQGNQSKAAGGAGGVLTATPAPHRPGTAAAPGVRSAEGHVGPVRWAGYASPGRLTFLPAPAPAVTGGRMSEVTRILSAIEQGEPRAAEQLLPLVYDELRQLATRKLAQEKPGQTLQATALVHEAYLRLVDRDTVQRWD